MRYKDVIVHSLIGVGVHALVVFVLLPQNAYKFLWATLALIVWLQVALLFTQKRLFNKRVGVLDDILESQFGFSLEDNQFNRRSRHFRAEKIRLAEVLTSEVLPRLVRQAQRDYPELKHLNIFLDSGTTITPAFRPLVFQGLPIEKERLVIHTNNLAGIDELHKLPQIQLESGKLSEEVFNLLPGSPLCKYRATTEGGMDKFLEGIWEEKRNSNGTTAAIGVLTANWILAGPGLDSLQICARGRGHLAFKKNLIENCDYVVVVSPLAKILRVDKLNELNDLISDPVKFRNEPMSTNKERTFLLTSNRPHHSLSPLRNITIELKNLQKHSGGKNYTLCPECPEYDPPGNAREVMATECPHDYVRDAFEAMYGITP
jgi:hypothetical protein